MAEEPLLTNQPRPDLNKLYPNHFFMTMFDTKKGKQVLVGTRRSLTQRPLYHRVPAQNDEQVQIAATMVVEALQKQYDKALVYHGRPYTKNTGGIISGWTDANEYGATDEQ